MNYSQKVLFDDWISKCPIDSVQVQEPVSMVRTEFGKWDYLIKVYLTIDKEDWEQNQANPGFSENSENFENFEKKQGSTRLQKVDEKPKTLMDIPKDWEGSSITIGDCLLDLQTHINELHDYFSQELKE